MIDDAIDLDPADRATVLELLHRHVPECEVRAYGSRVTWRARPYSDLDLAVIGSDVLGPLALMELREALANAPLPFLVDVLEWEALPDSFCREIERMYVVLQEARVVDGWRDVAVGDIAHIVGGGTPSTKRPEYFGGDVPWLTPKDLSVPHGRYVTRGNRSLTEQGLHQSSATLVPKRTVLLTTRAPVGYVALAAQPVSTNQGFRNLVVRDEHWPEFVYYWLLANTAELERHASGSTFRELSGSVLKLIRMRVPYKDEQRRIADVLGALDDRIELNRRMCATLEEMASALFKAWFVDFEPVRAKMEDRWREGESLPGLPAHLYDLFPDEFTDSELGPIPAGWQLDNLGSVLQLLYGKALPASKRLTGSVPVFGSNGRVGWHNEKYVDGPGIIVGRKGNPGMVVRVHEDFYPIDTTYYVEVSDERLTLEFLYYALGLQALASIGADSAVPGLNRNMAYMSRQLIPTKALVDAFSSHVSSLWRLDHTLDQSSRCLIQVRDALLPKLISGEIRVRESEDAASC